MVESAAGRLYLIAGPITNSANGHIYYLLDNDLPRAATLYAQSLGGHLATVRNAGEQQWLFETFAHWNRIPRLLCIGLVHPDPQATVVSQDERRAQFRWMSGEPVTYANWNLKEPNGWEGGNGTLRPHLAGRRHLE